MTDVGNPKTVKQSDSVLRLAIVGFVDVVLIVTALFLLAFVAASGVETTVGHLLWLHSLHALSAALAIAILCVPRLFFPAAWVLFSVIIFVLDIYPATHQLVSFLSCFPNCCTQIVDVVCIANFLLLFYSAAFLLTAAAMFIIALSASTHYFGGSSSDQKQKTVSQARQFMMNSKLK